MSDRQLLLKSHISHHIAWLVMILLLTCQGCSEPQITREVVTIPAEITKQEQEEAKARAAAQAQRKRIMEMQQPSAASKPGRMLAALIEQPNSQRYWSFKLTGATTALETHRQSFADLIASVTLPSTADEIPTWKLPDTWTSAPASDGFGRVATITIPAAEKPLQIAVASLSFQGEWDQALLLNLNRWRGQLGLPELTADKLNETVTEVKIAGGTASLIDIQSPSTAEPAAKPELNSPNSPPSTASKQPTKNSSELGFQAVAPTEWQVVSGNTTRLASYEIIVDGKKAEVAVTRFPGNQQMSDPLANANRWRGELKLPPLPQSELNSAFTTIQLAGKPAERFSGSNADRKTIAVMQIRGDQVWFIKLFGDESVVTAEEARLQSYLATWQFP